MSLGFYGNMTETAFAMSDMALGKSRKAILRKDFLSTNFLHIFRRVLYEMA